MLTEDVHRALVAHYTRVAPLLRASFGAIPIAWVTFPGGFAQPAVFHHVVDPLPHTIATVPVTTSTGTTTYVTLAENALLWLVHAHYAVEFVSWTPSPDDLARPRWAHVTLEPSGAATHEHVKAAARAVRDVLRAEGRDAFCVLDGFRGITLWIDARGAANFTDLAAWLTDVTVRSAATDPAHLTTAWLRAERGDRVYLGTRSNHPTIGVELPYGVRGTDDLALTWPVAWERLDDVAPGAVRVANAAEHLAAAGDVFITLANTLPAPLPIPPAPAAATHAHHRAAQTLLMLDDTPPVTPAHDYLLNAAMQVLADGRTATAEEIRDAAAAAGLIPASTNVKYVYAALHEFIIRTLGAGRTPPIVQIDRTTSFRLNRPADPWPPVTLPQLPRWLTDDAIAALVTRLETTSVGDDPTAFEVTVCDAFAGLGFVATHVGGEGRPDGLIDAPLGPLGWRATLECKTASPGGVVANPRPEEPAKFREANGATRALLVGPAFGSDASFLDELRVHDVSLWTAADLATALREQIGPAELTPLVTAGPVTDAITSLLWERDHGERKRIAVVANLIARLGWETQVAFAATAGNDDAPHLTDDVLLVAVDRALATVDPTLLVTRDLLAAAISQLLADGRATRVPDDGTLIRFPPPRSS